MEAVGTTGPLMNRQKIKEMLKEFYNTSAGYSSMLAEQDTKPFRFLTEMAQKWIPQGAHILDLGCGQGLSSYLLWQSGYKVTGIDLSEQLISIARARYARENIRFFVGDAEELKFADEEFDAVVSWALVEHLVHVEKAFSEMQRLVKKGGVVIIFASNMISPFKPYANLMKLLKGEKGHSMRGGDSKIKSILLIIKYTIVTVLKLLQRGFRFENREPNLAKVEPDNDTAWKANQIDIKRYFVEQGYKILQYQVPQRKLQFLDHFDTMVQIVIQKP